MRSFSRFLPRSHLQKNFAETPEVLRALLIVRRSRFFARPRRPDGPRRRFWARKWCPGATFSLRAGARCVLRPKSTKHCAGWRKLRFGPPTLVPQNDENSMLWLFARALAFRTRLGCVPASSGWPAEAPRTRPETLLGPLGTARAVPRAFLGPPQTRPGPFLDASPSVCRASPSASERSKVEFSCFLVVLGSIFLDPDELFDRFFDDPSIAEDRSTVPADSFAEATHWIFLPMRTGKLV